MYPLELLPPQSDFQGKIFLHYELGLAENHRETIFGTKFWFQSRFVRANQNLVWETKPCFGQNFGSKYGLSSKCLEYHLIFRERASSCYQRRIQMIKQNKNVLERTSDDNDDV